ncbi:MAG TPA: preprotein translocase subunit SecG [Treponemataceae bacterium]|nr:preprotein translocase subunit SecG [Treponemataceae bacterium]
MAIVGIVLLVVFVIICFLIIALVLMQNEEGDGLGGLFAGGSNSALDPAPEMFLPELPMWWLLSSF